MNENGSNSALMKQFLPNGLKARPAIFRLLPSWNHLLVSLTLIFAFVLSAVSFDTTWIGLNEFLAPKVPIVDTSLTGDAGSAGLASQNDLESLANAGSDAAILYKSAPNTQSRLLSAGTTFGIQGLMFVISIILGRYLIGLRPIERPALPVENEPASDKKIRHFNFGSQIVKFLLSLFSPQGMWFLLGIVFAALAVGRYWAWPLINVSGILSWFRFFFNGQALSAGKNGLDGLVLFYVLASVIGLWRSKLLGLSWSSMVMFFLLFVYLGTMIVSSTFSFDAYYRFLRSEADLKIESESIVGEEAVDIIHRTGQVLVKTVSEQERLVLASPAYATLKRNLSELNQKAEQYDEAVLRDRREAEAQQRLEVEGMRTRAAEAAGRVANADAEIARLNAEHEQLNSQLPTLEENIARLRREVQRVEEELEPFRKQRTAAKQRMDLEDSGADGRASGQGTKWTAAKADFDRANDYIELQENSIAQKLDSAITSRTELVAVFGAIPGLIAEQRSLVSGLDIGSLGAANSSITSQSIPQIVGSLDVKAAGIEFEKNLDRVAYQRLNDACNTMVSTMQRVIPNDETVSNFQCAPPNLAVLTSELFRLRNGQVHFDEACGELALQKIRVGAITDAFSAARACIQTTGLTSDKVGVQSNKLTQLISVHSTVGHDIRRSIGNFKRKEPFALGAAAGAVFVDSLILVVGILAAMMFQSPLLADPRAITAEDMQKDIFKALSHHSNGDPATAAMRIIELGENNPSFEYPVKIDISRLEKDDKMLVRAMVIMARSFIYPDTEDRYYLFHSNFIRLLYDIAVQGDQDDPQPSRGNMARPSGAEKARYSRRQANLDNIFNVVKSKIDAATAHAVPPNYSSGHATKNSDAPATADKAGTNARVARNRGKRPS